MKIKGTNLQIDLAIQKVCEASNATSGKTRSVLYLLVLVNVLSFAAVLNTCNWNWSKTGICRQKKAIAELKAELSKHDSVTSTHKMLFDSLDTEQRILNYKIRNHQDLAFINIAIINARIHVNDLSLVSGITYIVLMIVLSFMLGREISNIKIALNSITERYDDKANRRDFAIELQDFEGKEEEALSEINKIRRQHHYDYLTMNEVFNLPPLKTESRNFSTFTHYMSLKMFLFPSVVYGIIILNDVLTMDEVLGQNNGHVWFSLALAIVCWICVLMLSLKCNRQKAEISYLYTDFKDQNFRFVVDRK